MQIAISVEVYTGKPSEYKPVAARKININIPDDKMFKKLLPVDTLASAAQSIIQEALSEYDDKQAEKQRREAETLKGGDSKLTTDPQQSAEPNISS